MTVLWATTSVLLLVAVSTDFAERVWQFTRYLEGWQFDELLLAAAIASMFSLAFALARLAAQARQIDELETALIEARRAAAHAGGGLDEAGVGSGAFDDPR